MPRTTPQISDLVARLSPGDSVAVQTAYHRHQGTIQYRMGVVNHKTPAGYLDVQFYRPGPLTTVRFRPDGTVSRSDIFSQITGWLKVLP